LCIHFNRNHRGRSAVPPSGVASVQDTLEL
jgi:hypothetical protein